MDAPKTIRIGYRKANVRLRILREFPRFPATLGILGIAANTNSDVELRVDLSHVRLRRMVALEVYNVGSYVLPLHPAYVTQ